eukprot:CAMPEP_0185496330 /NCGR_PEP_ID=MMETSP1366-20130426/18205_1 /TAXON_ID=38817 /ORGANISM="Gephyrocapsa oceanica, Strain RCC1303" /LENGTH=94 /DNA_ID=CAMNT_0028105397 /DNA_START=191 /DNA_END=473 /DNA_ORIENTATION=+
MSAASRLSLSHPQTHRLPAAGAAAAAAAAAFCGGPAARKHVAQRGVHSHAVVHHQLDVLCDALGLSPPLLLALSLGGQQLCQQVAVPPASARFP